MDPGFPPPPPTTGLIDGAQVSSGGLSNYSKEETNNSVFVKFES